MRPCAAPVTRPSGDDPRTSTACAATSSSMATIALAQAHHLGQPPAGQAAGVLARSSMPSAPDVLSTVKRDRLGEQARLGGQGLGRDGVDAEAEVRPAARQQPGRQAGPRRVEQLDAALGRRAEDRGQRDADVVERGREPHDLVGRRREDAALGHRHQRVALRGVELDGRAARGRGRAPRAPAAWTGSVLRNVSGSCRLRRRSVLPEEAALAAGRGSARACAASTGSGRARSTAGSQGREVGGEALQASAAGHVRGVHQASGVGQRQRRLARCRRRSS